MSDTFHIEAIRVSDSGAKSVVQEPYTPDGNGLPGSSGSGTMSAVLTADFPKTNDTLEAVPDLTLDLEAGHWYRVTGQFCTTEPQGGGPKFDFNGGTVTAIGLQGAAMGWDNNQTSAVYVLLSALDTVISTSGGDSCVIDIDFTIQVSAGGTLMPRFAQVVTEATGTTLFKYATITAIDVTPV